MQPIAYKATSCIIPIWYRIFHCNNFVYSLEIFVTFGRHALGLQPGKFPTGIPRPNNHNRTGQGVGGYTLQPPDSGKPIISRVKAKFFWQKPAAKNEKEIFLLYANKIVIKIFVVMCYSYNVPVVY